MWGIDSNHSAKRDCIGGACKIREACIAALGTSVSSRARARDLWCAGWCAGVNFQDPAPPTHRRSLALARDDTKLRGAGSQIGETDADRSSPFPADLLCGW